MKDKKETSDIVDCVRDSLNLLADILDNDHKDPVDLEEKGEMIEKRTKYYCQDENGDKVELKDILKENYKLKRKIMFLKQQLIEKENKIRKLEFMFKTNL